MQENIRLGIRQFLISFIEKYPNIYPKAKWMVLFKHWFCFD